MKNFNKTSLAEFRAVVAIGAILILAVVIPRVYHKLFPDPPIEETGLQINAFDLPDDRQTVAKKVYRSTRKTGGNQRYRQFSNDHSVKDQFANNPLKSHIPETFRQPEVVHCQPFDPNEVSGADLTAMGVSSYVAGNLVKYRESGARFKGAEDLRRIYGMDSTLYAALAGCIRITPFTNNKGQLSSSIDINSAGHEEWKSLPGIGDVLAERIIKYRSYLGGFASIDQIAETYGLPSGTMEVIREKLLLKHGPDKIDVNSASVEELASHPYITQRQAEAIVNYRNTHGLFSETEDVLKIFSLDEMWYGRIQPYLRCGAGSGDASGLVVR